MSDHSKSVIYTIFIYDIYIYIMDYLNRHSTIAESEKAINDAGDTVEQYDWIRSPVLFREDIEVHGDVDLINGEYKINGVPISGGGGGTPQIFIPHLDCSYTTSSEPPIVISNIGIRAFLPVMSLTYTPEFEVSGSADYVRYIGTPDCFVKIDVYLDLSVTSTMATPEILFELVRTRAGIDTTLITSRYYPPTSPPHNVFNMLHCLHCSNMDEFSIQIYNANGPGTTTIGNRVASMVILILRNTS